MPQRDNRRLEPLVLQPLPVAKLLEVQYPEAVVLADDLLDEQGLLLVVAPTSMGKSFLLLQMAMALATATPFLGHAVPQARRVYLAQAEIGVRRFQQRVRKLWANYVPTMHAQPRNGHEVSNGALYLESTWNLKLDSDEGRAALIRVIADHAIDVTFIDPLRPFHAGDENSSKEMQLLLDTFATLQREYKTAVVVSHHDRKPNPEANGGKTLYDSRGSGVITDRPDTVARLKSMGRPDMVKLVWQKMRNRDEPLPEMALNIDQMSGLFVPVSANRDAQGSELCLLLKVNGGEMELAALLELAVTVLGLPRRNVQRGVDDAVASGGLTQTGSMIRLG